MFRNLTSFGGTLLLAGAALLATPALGWAQRGGHGGGGHFGGAHFGGAHFGGAHFGGGQFGGARFGGSHFGVPHSGQFHNGFGRFGSSHRWGGYGYGYPYYGYYGYSYPYYYPNTYDGPSQTYDPGYYGNYGDLTSSYPYNYSAYAAQPALTANAAPTQPDNTAHVTVNVPSEAQITFDGSKTTQTGSVREYVSPPLKPGQQYSYDVQARWKENGREVTQTQHVKVTAGAHVMVDFPAQSRATAQASAPSKDERGR